MSSKQGRHSEFGTDSWFATCPRGLESLLCDELESLGALSTRETVAGVYFSGARAVMYRACLWSRLANRVLWPLAELDASDEAIFYRGMRELDWDTVFTADKSFAIDFFGQNRVFGTPASARNAARMR